MKVGESQLLVEGRELLLRHKPNLSEKINNLRQGYDVE